MPIERVHTAADERLAGYRSVSDPSLASQLGLFVAEGRRVVERLLAEPQFDVRSVLVTETALEPLVPHLVGWPQVPVYVVPQDVMNGVSGFNVHRGCLALAARPGGVGWEVVVREARMLVVLERVGDADNVGAIFRCAAGLGVDGVLLGPGCADPLYRKAIRTSMGWALSLRWAHATPWPQVLGSLSEHGWLTVGLTPRRDAVPLWTIATHDAPRIALVFGHEGDGLSDAALDACGRLARIPMAGAVDSLNVGVSVGIALYEVHRGRVTPAGATP